MPFSVDPEPADDETECARCGAHFYYGLSRCPNCGVNLYEPEDDSPYIPPGETRKGWGFFKDLRFRFRRYLRRWRQKEDPADVLFGEALRQAEAFSDLLEQVNGDRMEAERLVELERIRFPSGNRLVWIRGAIKRREKDQ